MTPALELAFTVTVLLGDVIDVGRTAHGHRRVIPITGGTVMGPALSGRVLPAGADYQVIRPDGTTELEARYVLETGAGLVYVDNRGFRTASPDDVERLTRGEPVDPSRVYFRTTPRFETAVPELAWLQSTVFVALAVRHPDSVELSVYSA